MCLWLSNPAASCFSPVRRSPCLVLALTPGFRMTSYTQPRGRAMAFAHIWEARVRLICFCAHPRSDDICLCPELKDHVPHLVTQEMDKLQMCTFLFSLIPPAGFARPPSHPKAHRGEASSCDEALMESYTYRMTGQFGSSVDFRPRGQTHTNPPPRLRRPLQESHHRDFP